MPHILEAQNRFDLVDVGFIVFEISIFFDQTLNISQVRAWCKLYIDKAAMHP